MNNAITEIKSILGTNSRIAEAEEGETKKEKRIKRNEDNLRDLWDMLNPPIFKP